MNNLMQEASNLRPSYLVFYHFFDVQFFDVCSGLVLAGFQSKCCLPMSISKYRLKINVMFVLSLNILLGAVKFKAY